MHDGMMHMVKEIYRTHGWLHLEERHKRDCLLAIRIAIEAQYLGVSLKP